MTANQAADMSRLSQYSVRFLGDLDADGMSDFIVVGASSPDEVGPHGYVFYGRSQFPDQLRLEDADLVIEVTDMLAPLGDFNGDGYDDVAFLVNRERAALLLGGAQRRSGTLDLTGIPTWLTSNSGVIRSAIWMATASPTSSRSARRVRCYTTGARKVGMREAVPYLRTPCSTAGCTASATGTAMVTAILPSS